MPNRIDNVRIDDYYTILKEPHRPPSRGGNTSALHAHFVVIDETVYSFLARGSKKWAYARDTVSFDYDVNGEYFNIQKQSLRTIDSKGKEIVRGDRTYKPKLRTTQTRLPARRREHDD